MRLIVPKISHHKNIEKAVQLLPRIDENTIVFVGDSRVEWGVKPFIIEEKTGLNTVNLAMPGSNGMDVMAYLQNKKTHPKKIIIGVNYFSPSWRNFKKIEKIDIGLQNRLSLNIDYFFKQHSYLYEKKSLEQFYKEPPFFMGHKYDKKGGVVVKERGEYPERKNFQMTYFSKRVKEKNLDSLGNIYRQEISKKVSYFKKNGTSVIGLVMPICDDLRQLENYERVDSLARSIPFHRVENYLDNKRITLEENAFQDCSHLTPETANSFSKMLANNLSLTINH